MSAQVRLAECSADTGKKPSPKLFDLTGKTVFMTGASRGIGAAMAVGLAEAGAAICIAQRDVKNTDTRDACRAVGVKSEIVPCDLSKMDDCRAVFQKALDAMGGEIHILVNCGGMLQRADSRYVSEEEWDYVLNVNLKSTFIICQEAGKHMVPLKRGKIINVASLNSFIGGEGVISYSAAKGAVTQITKGLSNEWAKHNIQVNAIAPGFIATDINTDLRSNDDVTKARSERAPAQRWGFPADFVGPTLFLASEAAQYVTGAVLLVDGGVLCR